MQKMVSIDLEKINLHIIKWLESYANNAGVKGFVVGISGGIDSAVTSALCAQTGLDVLCVEMPIHQDLKQVSRGREHIEFLKSKFENVRSTEKDLTATFEIFKETLPVDADPAKINLSLANSRARLRMTTLYYYAGIYGLLVAGTGNKIEDFGVGFYTKYGDGGVDLSPIADLMKSEVYALGKYLGIPLSILNATPTDGLFGDDRTDEDQLGASYDELEWAMLYKEKGENPQLLEGRNKEVYEIYSRLNRINQHKMLPVPVCEIPR